MNRFTKSHTEALINGNIVQYDNADSTYDPSLHSKFEYLGKGIVYSVNGVIQKNPKVLYHFWKAKNN